MAAVPSGLSPTPLKKSYTFSQTLISWGHERIAAYYCEVKYFTVEGFSG
jgi:hypothetical protein